MLVTENVTVNVPADGGDEPAAVWTLTCPVVAPGGTRTLSDVAVTFVGTADTPPAKSTRSAPKRPLPLIVISMPVEPLSGPKLAIRGSIVKVAEVDVPPAFVTEIGPDCAPGGTVTSRLVPPTPTTNADATTWLNFTDVVPVNVFPVMVTCVPAAASFGSGPDVIVGRIFNGVGPIAVPFPPVTESEEVRPLAGRADCEGMSVCGPRTNAHA